jgi:hypothetical protein
MRMVSSNSARNARLPLRAHFLFRSPRVISCATAPAPISSSMTSHTLRLWGR